MLIVYSKDCFKCRHKLSYKNFLRTGLRADIRRTDINKQYRSEVEHLDIEFPFIYNTETGHAIHLSSSITKDDILAIC